MSNRVVAHFLDGHVVKGASYDVAPAKPTCHLQTPSGSVEVRLSELKALFFVKDLAGNPAYREASTMVQGDMRAVGARRVEIRFRDGEQLMGLAAAYSPEPQFFYVSPVDPTSNNIRILVNRAAATSIRPL